MFTSPYSRPLHSPKLSHYPGDSHYPATSLSHTPREADGDREREGIRSCPNSQQPVRDLSMSRDFVTAGPLSDDAPQPGARTLIDENGPTNRHPSRRPPLRTRPQSWHPYGPVEPPLESSSSRSIGVHAILNPPVQGAADPPGASGRELRSLPGPSSSPRLRQGSSPISRPVPALGPQPLSPRSHSRPVRNTDSPSARFMGASGRNSGQSSVSHSPLVPQEPSLGARQPTVGSPLSLDTNMLRPIASLPVTQPTVGAALHSSTSLHSRRTSAGSVPLTNPNLQDTSPTTPHSGYSHFDGGSPAVTTVSLPPNAAPHPAGGATPFVPLDSIGRDAPTRGGPRSSVLRTRAVELVHQEAHPWQG